MVEEAATNSGRRHIKEEAKEERGVDGPVRITPRKQMSLPSGGATRYGETNEPALGIRVLRIQFLSGDARGEQCRRLERGIF